MIDRSAKRRAVADEIVGALRARIERRARNGENLPSLFEREARGDQRAGSPRRLHDHDPVGQAGDDAVAAWKIAPAGLPAHGHFRNHRAAILDDREKKRLVLGRIDPVVAAGEHRDGAAGQRRLVGSGIDAAGEAGHDDITRLAELARKSLREREAGSGRVARTHDGDGRARQKSTEPRTPIRGAAPCRRPAGSSG